VRDDCDVCKQSLRTVRRQEIDPATGRYIQSDPIGFDGGVNTYVYVGANPIIFYDENGLKKGWKLLYEIYGIVTDGWTLWKIYQVLDDSIALLPPS